MHTTVRRPHPTLRSAGLLLLLLMTLFVSACGAGGRDVSPAPTSPADSAAGGEPAAERESDEEAEAGQPPSRQARAAGRRFDALLAAYAPVSARVNFLVAAETLRADALEAGVSEVVERERFGAVRLEIRRMQRLIANTRPRIAAVTVGDVDQKRVQDLMLATVDSRARALRELNLALDALADEETPDSEAEERVDTWRASWNESLRAAREATSALQQSRVRLGLEPASEESIR